jgi:hypothetical protein
LQEKLKLNRAQSIAPAVLPVIIKRLHSGQFTDIQFKSQLANLALVLFTFVTAMLLFSYIIILPFSVHVLFSCVAAMFPAEDPALTDVAVNDTAKEIKSKIASAFFTL